ncbi:MAG: transglutaminase domain-containing protein, partial [Clostridia bacterium]|nr:transglutaminase domain-containing protein [Clostridia bacterium]
MLSACAFAAPDEPVVGITKATLAPVSAQTVTSPTATTTILQTATAAAVSVTMTAAPQTTPLQTTAQTTPTTTALDTTAPEPTTSTTPSTITVTTATTTAATTTLPTTEATTAATIPATTTPTTVPTTAVTTVQTTTAMTLESLNFGATPITVDEPNVGGEVYGNAEATVDATDKALGYVLVKYHGEQGVRLKVLVTGPSGTQYTYHLNNKAEFEVFPFSDGNGDYTIGVYRNTTGNKYATVFKTTLNVAMRDAYAAFLHPNQYVNYHSGSQILRIAAQLTSGLTDPLAKVEAIYRYVTETITYDYAL